MIIFGMCKIILTKESKLIGDFIPLLRDIIDNNMPRINNVTKIFPLVSPPLS